MEGRFVCNILNLLHWFSSSSSVPLDQTKEPLDAMAAAPDVEESVGTVDGFVAAVAVVVFLDDGGGDDDDDACFEMNDVAVGHGVAEAVAKFPAVALRCWRRQRLQLQQPQQSDAVKPIDWRQKLSCKADHKDPWLPDPRRSDEVVEDTDLGWTLSVVAAVVVVAVVVDAAVVGMRFGPNDSEIGPHWKTAVVVVTGKYSHRNCF